MMQHFTAEELRHVDRDVLAERVLQLQAELTKPCGECHPCVSNAQAVVEENVRLRKALALAKTVTLTGSVRMAFINAPDDAMGTVDAPLRAAFRAAGLTVTDDGEGR